MVDFVCNGHLEGSWGMKCASTGRRCSRASGGVWLASAVSPRSPWHSRKMRSRARNLSKAYLVLLLRARPGAEW